MSLREEVEAALDVEPVSARDRGTATLALTYAAQIDEGGDLAKLGPALLAALEALQMSPRARKVVKIDDKPTVNPLDALSERRLRRSRAAGGDATTA